MKKCLSSALLALLVVLLSLMSNICVASAAMRNLLSEFNDATNIFTYNRDDRVEGLSPDIDYKQRLKQVDTLIKQGLHVEDTVMKVCNLALNISQMYKNGNTTGLDKAEEFCIALIQRLRKAKADFKDVFGDKFLGSMSKNSTNDLTNNLLGAFLDAGADPNQYSGNPSLLNEIFTHSPHEIRGYFDSDKISYSWNDQKAKINLERAKMLLDHKVSLGSLAYNWYICVSHGDSAMAVFLKNMPLVGDFPEDFDKKRFEYISNMLELLHNAKADPKDAKDYLAKIREANRNTPEALKQIDRVEKLVNKSSFCSLWNGGLFAYGILFLPVLIAKKKANK